MTDNECDVIEVWEKFSDDLNNSEWADNIAVQGLSDMLSIRLNIISSQNNVVTEILPTNSCESIGTINLSLLGQVHYVGLDKISRR